MGRSLNQALHQAWRERVSRQESSGKSISEFCRQEGISPPSFFAWKRRLRINPSIGPLPSKAGPRKRQGRAILKRSLGVRRGVATVGIPGSSSGVHADRTRQPGLLAGSFHAIACAPPCGTGWTELVLGDGTLIRVPSENLAALELVLSTLTGRAKATPDRETWHA